jgi:hypothetical protein
MNAVRRLAIGRECQIRLPGCLTEPCCLCHFRMSGISGMGLKSPDFLGAWGCAACHDIVDREQRHDLQTQFDFALAVFRTKNILYHEKRLRLTA